MWMLKCCQ